MCGCNINRRSSLLIEFSNQSVRSKSIHLRLLPKYILRPPSKEKKEKTTTTIAMKLAPPTFLLAALFTQKILSLPTAEPIEEIVYSPPNLPQSASTDLFPTSSIISCFSETGTENHGYALYDIKGDTTRWTRRFQRKRCHCTPPIGPLAPRRKEVVPDCGTSRFS